VELANIDEVDKFHLSYWMNIQPYLVFLADGFLVSLKLKIFLPDLSLLNQSCGRKRRLPKVEKSRMTNTWKVRGFTACHHILVDFSSQAVSK
jgi:hypothetical protein